MSIKMSIEWSKITIIVYLTLAWTIDKIDTKNASGGYSEVINYFCEFVRYLSGNNCIRLSYRQIKSDPGRTGSYIS